jgi:hypothetical protein
MTTITFIVAHNLTDHSSTKIVTVLKLTSVALVIDKDIPLFHLIAITLRKVIPKKGLVCVVRDKVNPL